MTSCTVTLFFGEFVEQHERSPRCSACYRTLMHTNGRKLGTLRCPESFSGTAQRVIRCRLSKAQGLIII